MEQYLPWFIVAFVIFLGLCALAYYSGQGHPPTPIDVTGRQLHPHQQLIADREALGMPGTPYVTPDMDVDDDSLILRFPSDGGIMRRQVHLHRPGRQGDMYGQPAIPLQPQFPEPIQNHPPPRYVQALRPNNQFVFVGTPTQAMTTQPVPGPAPAANLHNTVHMHPGQIPAAAQPAGGQLQQYLRQGPDGSTYLVATGPNGTFIQGPDGNWYPVRQ